MVLYLLNQEKLDIITNTLDKMDCEIEAAINNNDISLRLYHTLIDLIEDIRGIGHDTIDMQRM